MKNPSFFLTAGPQGTRDADLMYMSKNLNQRIQESYERSSAQVTLPKIIRFPAVCCVLLHLKWTNFLPTGFAQTEGGEAGAVDGPGEDAERAQDGHGGDG